MTRREDELKKLPWWRLTCEDFTHLYPNLLFKDHYEAVKAAIDAGEDVPAEVLSAYPRLRARRARLRREKTNG